MAEGLATRRQEYKNLEDLESPLPRNTNPLELNLCALRRLTRRTLSAIFSF